MVNYIRRLSSSRKQDMAVCLIGISLMLIAMLLN